MCTFDNLFERTAMKFGLVILGVVLCTAHSVMIVYVHFSFEDSAIETEHLHPTCGL